MADELSGADRGSSPPSFDFDDDAITNLLDSFVETQTGPQSKKISRPPDPDDAGARAAQRTVFQHRPRHETLPLVGDSADAKKRRIELLDALAARAVGSTRARLLTSAAELREQLGDAEAATQDYEQASLADARDVVVLRALRRHALLREDWTAAVKALEKEAALDLGVEERAAALRLLAEIQLSKLGDAAAAEQAASHAAALVESDFVAWILAAQARLARGQQARAAQALASAAQRWPTTKAQAVILMHAAELMERAGVAAEARELYERVLGLEPGRLAAHFGLVRTAFGLGEAEVATDALCAAASHVPASVAAALRRAAALASETGESASRASSLLADAEDTVSRWTFAEAQLRAANVDGACSALALAARDETPEIGGVRTARHARLLAELGRISPRSIDSHPALASYVDSLRGLQGSDEEPTLDRPRPGLALDDASLAAAMVVADELAMRGDHSAFLKALEGELDDAPPAAAEGAALAIAEASVGKAHLSTLLTLEERLPTARSLRRALALIDTDALRSALRWRDEAAERAGVRRAFALGMAARLTRGTEASRNAWEAAREAAPGYLPALWSLERDGDTDDARMLAAAAQADADPDLGDAHRLRASLWAATPEQSSEHALTALDRGAPDRLLLEHLFSSAGRTTEAAGDWMMLAAARHDVVEYLIRAAACYRASGLSGRAAKVLREASAASPDDALVRVRRKDAELHAGEFARLADSTMQQARAASDEPEQLRAFAAMAEVDRFAKRDMQSARLSLQSIAEMHPSYVPTARALEWDALRARDPERIRTSVRRLIDALPPGAAERLARRRLMVELLRADPDIRQSDVDRVLCDIDEPLETDPGLARQALGAAYAEGNTELGVQALIAIQASLGSDLERAAVGLEAALTLERGGEMGRALEALNMAGNHPLALEAEAGLLRAAKRWEDAAAVYREAATHAKDKQRAASLWREAACILEEQLLHRGAALQAWQAAASCDITYRDVYRRLAACYQEAGLEDDLERLIETRIEAGADTPALVGLLLDKAALQRRRGDVAGVIQTLDECLELDPHHFGALRKIVDTQRGQENWQGATEALIRIARLKRSSDEQVWAFSQLAEVYHEHLSDLPRAEASLRRALELAPAHTETLDRLASVLTQSEKPREAVRILQELVRRSATEVEQRDYRIRLAETVEQAGEGRQAEAMLEQLRREQPTHPDVILAVADYYARQGAGPAEFMHLNRAVNDLREAIEARPGDETNWTTLVRVLERRHGPDAASCAASAAIAVGHPASLFEGSVTARGEALGEPPLPLSAAVEDVVAPPSLPLSVRRLFTLCEHSFEKMLPFDAGAWRLRRPSGAQRALVEEAGQVAAALGISEPRLRVTFIAPVACMPISGDPPTLVVGGGLHELTTQSERVFLFARALKVAANHMAPALRARPDELDAALLALLQGHDPSRARGPEPEQLQDLRKKLIKAVPRRSRDEVESLVLELRGNSAFSTRLVPFAVSALGDRVALTLTGDVPSAVDALLKAAGHDVPSGHLGRLEAIRETPEAWALVRFAIDDAHFEARAQAGVDP